MTDPKAPDDRPVTLELGAHADPAASAHSGHDEFHLPPNSWIPLAVSLSLTITFVGFTTPDYTRPWLWAIGVVLLVICLVAWAISARREFAELP